MNFSVLRNPGTCARIGSSLLVSLALLTPFAAYAQPKLCAGAKVRYWIGSPSGSEFDAIAQFQLGALRRRCPNVETAVEFKPGGDGIALWEQINQVPADGKNLVGVSLPAIVYAPLAGTGRFNPGNISPVYWFNYTPEALVVNVGSPLKSFADFLALAKKEPDKTGIHGGPLKTSTHIAHQRLNGGFALKTPYVPFASNGAATNALVASQTHAALTTLSVAMRSNGRLRVLAIAAEQRHPGVPDVPTFRELGVNWVDGTFRGIAVPQSTSADVRKDIAYNWSVINQDSYVVDMMTKFGFVPIAVGPDNMSGFMAERMKTYTEAAAAVGMGR